ncbi:uncharacterized protein LOC144366018 isoform X1 [Ictidomys tridecemlineatus]
MAILHSRSMNDMSLVGWKPFTAYFYFPIFLAIILDPSDTGLQQDLSLLQHHIIIRSKGQMWDAHSLVSSTAVQSARLELLLFYVYLLLSCACGTSNECFLSSHIFLPSSVFCSINGQKTNIVLTSRFRVKYTDLVLYMKVILQLASFKEELIEKITQM